MTLVMTPRIRRWEASAIVVFVTGARPVKAYLFFYFISDVIYFQDLVVFVHPSSGSSQLFPSITGDWVECRPFFTWPAIVQDPTTMSTGPCLG
jgi:hypothetical protein